MIHSVIEIVCNLLEYTEKLLKSTEINRTFASPGIEFSAALNWISKCIFNLNPAQNETQKDSAHCDTLFDWSESVAEQARCDIRSASKRVIATRARALEDLLE